MSMKSSRWGTFCGEWDAEFESPSNRPASVFPNGNTIGFPGGVARSASAVHPSSSAPGPHRVLRAVSPCGTPSAASGRRSRPCRTGTCSGRPTKRKFIDAQAAASRPVRRSTSTWRGGAYNPPMMADRRLLEADASRRQHVIDLLTQSVGAEGGLQYAYVFGSFIEAGPFHDVDVAVRYSSLTAYEADGGRSICRAASRPWWVCPWMSWRSTAARSVLLSRFRGRALVVRDDDALTTDIERTARDYFDQERRLRQATMEAFAR